MKEKLEYETRLTCCCYFDKNTMLRALRKPYHCKIRMLMNGTCVWNNTCLRLFWQNYCDKRLCCERCANLTIAKYAKEEKYVKQHIVDEVNMIKVKLMTLKVIMSMKKLKKKFKSTNYWLTVTHLSCAFFRRCLTLSA